MRHLRILGAEGFCSFAKEMQKDRTMATFIHSPFGASEIVRFNRISNDGSYAYTINDSPSRVITYNLLNGLYIKERSTGVFCCSIESREGQYQLYRLQEEEFWRIIQGTSFLVVTDLCTLRISDSYLSQSFPLGQSMDEIFNHMEKGYQDIQSIVYAAPCYQFVELSAASNAIS